MASTEVSFCTLKVISVKEPLMTGTRIPQPPMVCASSGKILVRALAAPVARTT